MAAQTCYWDNAGADNDWGAAGNWYTTTEADRVPVTGDTVIFDGRTSGDCTGTMDQTGVDLAGLYIYDSYTGTIGATGAPLITECAGTMLIGGSGDKFIQVGNDANDADVLLTIINTSGNVELSSQTNQAAGNIAKFTTVYVLQGTVTIHGDEDTATHGGEDGTFVGTLYIAPTNTRGNNVTVTMGDACFDQKNTAYTDVYMREGTFTFCSTLDDLHIYGGKVYNGSTLYDMAAADDTITSLILYDGTFYWLPSNVTTSVRTTAATAPTITTAHILGGKFDATDMLETATTAPTITTMNMYPGCEVDLENGYANFIVTTLNKYGGTIKTSPGQALTLA